MNDLIKKENNSLQSVAGFDIEGLEDVPVSILPVPFLRLVQPTSTKIETKDGSEAGVGNFFYNDTQEEVKLLNFALLKAKVGRVQFEGQDEPSTKMNILGFDIDRCKVFILQLSVMSFSNFGKLIAQMKEKDITKSYTHTITMTTSPETNKKGKYYVANFQLGNEVPAELFTEIEEKVKVYGVALNRDISDKEPVEVIVENEDSEVLNNEPTEDIQVDKTTPKGDENVNPEDLPF
jgi:hypothetical protein